MLSSMKKNVILIAVCLSVLSLFASCRNGGPTTTSTPPPSNLVPRSVSLVNNDIQVLAKTNYDIPFSVNSTMYNVKVVGTYNTFGGLPNIIESYVMGDAAYVVWLRGQKADILFDSNPVSSGSLKVSVPGKGKYHLLFSNYAEATVAPYQQVHAEVRLEWDEPAK
jgi:hypothetical protein